MVKIVTANVRGLTDNGKRKQIFHYFRKMCFDIILIQETHSEISCKDKWRMEWGGDIVFAHGTRAA